MTLQTDVGTILERGVNAGDVVGAVAQVVTGDEILAAAAAGQRSAGGAAPMTLDTVCRIFSMTKPFTCTAAMQLVERGDLHLDMPASSVLSNLPDAGVLEGFDADGEAVVRPARRDITLRHLMTHTAGFGYAFWSESLLRYQQATGTDSMPSGDLAANAAVPALFDPGERWLYGINIDFVGRMVEEAASQRLDHYIEEHITGPLGMDSTAFTLSDEMQSRQAALHSRGPDGSLAVIDFGPARPPEYLSGGGGLHGTVTDYSRFVQMILGRGSRDGVQVLRPGSVDQMTTNQIGDLRVVELRTAMPDQTNDAEFFRGTDKTWSLAFQVNEAPLPTGRPAGGLMWAGFANSYFWIDMENQIAGAYISQHLPFADARSHQLFNDIETAAYRRLRSR